MDNLLVHATERISYGWIDSRAAFAGDASRDYWHIIWMAVSCCCGLKGEAEPVRLPAPEPQLPVQTAAEIADMLVATGMG
jgi:hypothetical protein